MSVQRFDHSHYGMYEYYEGPHVSYEDYAKLEQRVTAYDDADMVCSREIMEKRLADLPKERLMGFMEIVGVVIDRLHGPKMDGPHDDAESLLLILHDCAINVVNTKLTETVGNDR